VGDQARCYALRILLLYILLCVAIAIVAGRLLGKQQRLYWRSRGTPDSRRADDLESAPLATESPQRSAWNFFVAGTLPRWMRGSGDETFKEPYYNSLPPPPVDQGAEDGQWQLSPGEGWCPDPFGRHQSRWMSAGSPTSLVRDDGVESHDDPVETLGDGNDKE
jgi:hypothetical protein